MSSKHLLLLTIYVCQSATAQPLVNGFGLPLMPETHKQSKRAKNHAEKHAVLSEKDASAKVTPDDFPAPTALFLRETYNIDPNLSITETMASGEWINGGQSSLKWQRFHSGAEAFENFREAHGRTRVSYVYIVDTCTSGGQQSDFDKDRCNRMYDSFVKKNQAAGLAGYVPTVGVLAGGRGLEFDVGGFSSKILENLYQRPSGVQIGITTIFDRNVNDSQ